MENQNKENENNGFWSPSVRLRYIEKCIYSNEFSARYEKVLQQLYTSDTGIQEWREIQLESEQALPITTYYTL